MRKRKRIYLDHAATSWPKSNAVLEAMERYNRQCGAAAGRGGYQAAAEADTIVASARRAIANVIAAPAAASVSLHSNGTTALNAAIHGLVRPGDHVVTSAAEHNSVLRPLYHLEIHHGIRLTVVPVDDAGRVDAQQLLDAVEDETRLVALTHASNVTGAVQPVTDVGLALKSREAFFLCDAAQSFGTLPINVIRSGIDLLAAPGHKCSGGPLGTGFLYVSEGAEPEMIPALQGGTGSQSESLEMPTTMPSMLEAGNLNVPAIAGWAAALVEVQSTEPGVRAGRALALANRLHRGLQPIPHVRTVGVASELPIASIAIEGLAPTDAATILDAEFGVETRAGLHCAAQIHAFLGSAPEGTLRISAGHTSTDDEIDAFLESLQSMVSALHSV